MFGLTHVVKSDNGPPFSSKEFKLFAEDLGCDTQMVKKERRCGKICKNYKEGFQDNHNKAFAEGNFTFSLILNPNFSRDSE